MSLEKNKLIVRRFIEEYQINGREDVALELLATDFIDHSAFQGFSPDKQGVIQLFTVLRNAFSEFRAEIRDQVAEGDKVVTRKTFRGRHTGDFMGISPTDRPIEIGVIDILRVENEQIVEHWCQLDFAELMNQIKV